MSRKQQSKQKVSNSVIITIIVAIIGLIGTLGGSYLNYRATLDSKKQEIALANTQLAVQINSTNAALTFVATPIATALIIPPGLCIEDDFSDESKSKINFPVVLNTFNVGTEETIIDSGKYIWKMNAVSPVRYQKQLILNQGVDIQKYDFELEFDIQKIKGLESTDYGVVFSEEDSSKSFRILISPQRQILWVDKKVSDKWIPLIPRINVSSINQSGINNFKIVTKETAFQIYINGDLAGEFVDSEYKISVTNLAAVINESDSDVILEIDNFRLCNIH